MKILDGWKDRPTISYHINVFVNIAAKNPLYEQIMIHQFLKAMFQSQLLKHIMFLHAMAFFHVAFDKIHIQLPKYHILNCMVVVLTAIKTCIMDFQH